jgi:hypothetical protein
MSHFTVLVCVSKEKLNEHNGDIHHAVKEMMAPYQENNMGDCPQEYLEFQNNEDEYREDYENESTDIKTKYDSFDKYMYNHLGYSKDPQTGQYGYLSNPNSKWDYWRIGGRWSGMLYVKPGTEINTSPRDWDSPDSIEANRSDVCKISDLDLEKITQDMTSSAEKFWDKYVPLRKLGKLPGEKNMFYGTRETAFELGLCKVIKDPEEGKKLCGFRWGDTDTLNHNDDRANWYDIYDQNITREIFMKEWARYFCPIRTYAALDENGWHEPGEMGWFGCSSAEPEDNNSYSKSFMSKFIIEKDPDTILVVCDCHV